MAYAKFVLGVAHIVPEKIQMCGNIAAHRSYPMNVVTILL